MSARSTNPSHSAPPTKHAAFCHSQRTSSLFKAYLDAFKLRRTLPEGDTSVYALAAELAVRWIIDRCCSIAEFFLDSQPLQRLGELEMSAYLPLPSTAGLRRVNLWDPRKNRYGVMALKRGSAMVSGCRPQAWTQKLKIRMIQGVRCRCGCSSRGVGRSVHCLLQSLGRTRRLRIVS